MSANMAYFGRLTYSYDNRYSVQFNFRADAFDSSKLSKEARWGKFPSFSAGWTVSNESFIKDNISTDILSFLKIRGSWGRNISATVDMNVLKREKKLEMWLEGTRWIDMVRWGDFDLAKKAGTEVTSLYDKLTRPIKGGDKVCEEHDRFYTVFSPEAAGRATGFQAGKHELFPFPNTVLSLNPNITQNPNW